MSKLKWRTHDSDAGKWWAYGPPDGWCFLIDHWPDGTYASHYAGGGDEERIGPHRKTRQAAVNDCKRYALKLRAELVQFGRAKLL